MAALGLRASGWLAFFLWMMAACGGKTDGPTSGADGGGSDAPGGPSVTYCDETNGVVPGPDAGGTNVKACKAGQICGWHGSGGAYDCCTYFGSSDPTFSCLCGGKLNSSPCP